MMFLKKLTNGILDRRYWCLCVIDGFGFAANGHRQPKQWKYFFLVPALANCAVFLRCCFLCIYACLCTDIQNPKLNLITPRVDGIFNMNSGHRRPSGVISWSAS